MELYNPQSLPAPQWGPSGEQVFQRTYQRDNQSWAETVDRVVRGNMAYAYGKDESKWTDDIWSEAKELFSNIYDFKIIPAGRHLWVTGTSASAFNQNCFVAGWDDNITTHFTFLFMRMMEGGGVGSNYSGDLTSKYGEVKNIVDVKIVCAQNHPDIEEVEPDANTSSAVVVDDSREGWAESLATVLGAMYEDNHGDHPKLLIFDVSNVRERGAELKTFGGTASGPGPLVELLRYLSEVSKNKLGQVLSPVDLMEIDHEIAKAVVSGGARRSARMSIVRWDDPYIFDFIDCKKDFSTHWSTNISVEVNDDFFSALDAGNERAQEVFRRTVEAMIHNGEPGFYNSSLSSIGEHDAVRATNPCGEFTLAEWENCCIINVNMSKFAPLYAGDVPDTKGLLKAHRLASRMATRATLTEVKDPLQREVRNRNRRFGVGHLGVQGFVNKSGKKFSEIPEWGWFHTLLENLYQEVRDTNNRYADELGINRAVKVTTIAPTGSVAKLSGDTEGIHPVYAKYYLRRIRFSDSRPSEQKLVKDYRLKGHNVVPDIYAANTSVVEIPTKDKIMADVEEVGWNAEEIVESADQIPFDAMLEVQAVYQKHYADNAVSFTVNFPEGDLPVEGAVETLRGVLPRLKGTTVMPDGTRPLAPYERLTRTEWALQVELVGVSVEDSTDLDCAQGGACPIK